MTTRMAFEIASGIHLERPETYSAPVKFFDRIESDVLVPAEAYTA